MKTWNNREFPAEWHKYPYHAGEFMGQPYIVVCPKDVPANGKWILKTEYFGAFPETEFALLERGYHVAHVHNISRWCPDEVTETQAAFVDFVHSRFGLSKTCVPVGMSCGGMQAIFLAAKYPETVSCMFIDAPVLNYCDFPGRLGNTSCEKVWENEFLKTYPGMTRAKLLDFPHHPMNMANILIENKIPIIMLYGTEDSTVIYNENGAFFEEAYKETPELLTVVKREYQGHHPHGIPQNPEIIVDFILKHINLF